ncbi:MAG TPA: hypothetical protein VH575_18065 [Gemmataceae bacterium]|jgi:hypothetical protein
MNKRAKRYLIIPAVVMTAFAVLLACLEWERRQKPLAGQSRLDGSGQALSAEDLVQKYQNPEALAQLCMQVRERFAAVYERTLTSSHTRTTRLTEYDRRGDPVGITETVEHVWFEGAQEKTRLIRQRVLLGSESSARLGKSNLSKPAGNTHWPFPKNAEEDVYTYRFDGVEEIEGRPAGRIHFEPRTTAGLMYQGWAWVVMETGEPVRIQLAPVKPPPFVDRLEVLLDYGRAENGHNQARRAIFDGSGGFAFLTKHLRVESELSDYHERKQ